MISISRWISNSIAAVAAVMCLAAVVGGCAGDPHTFLCAGDTSRLLTIDFKVDDAVQTRAYAMPHESIVRDAYLMFFDDEPDDSSARWLGFVKAGVEGVTSGSLSFAPPGFLTPGKDYRVLALANADGFTPPGFDNYMLYLAGILPSRAGEYLSMAEVRTAIEFGCQDMIAFREDADADSFSLPMAGDMGSSHLRYSASGDSMASDAGITFRRGVARVDIINNADASLRIESVGMCNFRKGCRPLLDDPVWGNLGGIPGEDISDADFLPFGSGDSDNPAAGTRMLASLYVFPNKSDMNAGGDLNSTAVILKCRYRDPKSGEEDESPSYYRVNLGSLGSPQSVWPNSLYRLNISSVRGRGRETAEDAYRDSECLIELAASSSGWNEPGVGYDMDDDGNFIVVSMPKVIFPAAMSDPARILVFASPGVSWNVEPDVDASGFIVTGVTGDSFELSPKEANSSDMEKTATFTVTGNVASTGSVLHVTVEATQLPGAGVIDWSQYPPMALIPEEDATASGHLKISHQKNEDGTWSNRIDIDGFEPSLFNTFLDIPFSLHLDPSLEEEVSASVSADLEWPMEGRVSSTPAGNLKYTWDSFKEKPIAAPVVNLKDKSRLYVSVGVMAPDDPQIVRTITLSAPGAPDVIYTVTVKPRPIVIDDVIVTLSDGTRLMICDRNVQDYKNKDGYAFTCWNSAGFRESQAYHYGNYENMIIPGKKDEYDNPVKESFHRAFGGAAFDSSASQNSLFKNYVSKEWYTYCKCENCKLSPFYTSSRINEWGLPTLAELKEIFGQIKASKMRLYFLSDLKLDDGKEVCCYLPFITASTDPPSEFNMCGYMIADELISNSKGLIVYLDDIGNLVLLNEDNQYCKNFLARYVRKLSSSDIKEYTDGYLSSSPLRPCEPDTWPYTQPY